MKVSNVQNNKNTPHFTSWKRNVYSDIDGLLYRNDTSVYRDGKFWKDACDFFVDRFSGAPKVNVYSYGCSDGSEPVTFLMQMFSNFSEAIANKFKPIIAKDCDKDAISLAKSGTLKLSSSERADIDRFTGGQCDRFIVGEDLATSRAKLSEELTGSINYDLADIVYDYEKIEPNNTIVFARNFWPYIRDYFTRLKLTRNLGKQLQGNSCLVIGQKFDQCGTDYKIVSELIDAGFTQSEIKGIFVKNN